MKDRRVVGLAIIALLLTGLDAFFLSAQPGLAGSARLLRLVLYCGLWLVAGSLVIGLLMIFATDRSVSTFLKGYVALVVVVGLPDALLWVSRHQGPAHRISGRSGVAVDVPPDWEFVGQTKFDLVVAQRGEGMSLFIAVQPPAPANAAEATRLIGDVEAQNRRFFGVPIAGFDCGPLCAGRQYHVVWNGRASLLLMMAKYSNAQWLLIHGAIAEPEAQRRVAEMADVMGRVVIARADAAGEGVR